MTAAWQNNDVVDTRRRCDLRPYSRVDGSRAPRQTDFNGYIYISLSSADYIKALGTITNKRRILEIDDDVVEATDLVANTLHLTAHGYELGDGPIHSDTTAGNLVADTDYWIIPSGADDIQLAASLEDAYAGTAIDLDVDATGAILSDVADTTQRGIDGEFLYEASQEETDFVGSEAVVSIFGHATYDGYTTVMVDNAASALAGVGEGDNSIADLIRGIWAVVAGPVEDFTTGTYAFKDPTTGLKTRLTVTSDETGRKIVIVGDLG